MLSSKAAVCRAFGIKRSTLIDSLARIGWSAGANLGLAHRDALEPALDDLQIGATLSSDRKRLIHSKIS